ncbi:multinuclear nonheme iron-dependent oxidase [Streptomyces sp. NPDC001927]
MTELGVGIGWRPEIAGAVEALPGVDWVEVVAENVCAGHLPDALARLRERGVTVVPHGVSLGLGGADRPDPARLAELAATATALGAPLVTEHIAFVRAGGALTATPVLEAGHLLPVPRTWDALDVLCENVRIAQDALPVPLALENIAALIAWPGEELTEGQFLAELVERTGVRLLIDVANLHTNHVNRGESPAKALSELPVEAIAYVHVAGGLARDGVWHDTHAHPVPEPVLDILSDLASRVSPPGVLLERDDNFPPAEELAAELTTIRGRLRDAATRPATARAATARVADPAPLIGAGARVSGGPMPQSLHTAEEAEQPADTAADTRAPRPTPNPAARQSVAVAQASLLSALVAGAPVPEGFDSRRIGVQSRALVGKRTDVIAKIAPELPEILGDGYRPAFRAYARTRPMSSGYRRDALDFVAHLLVAGRPEDPDARRRLTRWWQDRAGARPPRPAGRIARAARAARTALVRR